SHNTDFMRKREETNVQYANDNIENTQANVEREATGNLWNYGNRGGNFIGTEQNNLVNSDFLFQNNDTWERGTNFYESSINELQGWAEEAHKEICILVSKQDVMWKQITQITNEKVNTQHIKETAYECYHEIDRIYGIHKVYEENIASMNGTLGNI